MTMLMLFLPETMLVVLTFVLLCLTLAKEVKASFAWGLMALSSVLVTAGCAWSMTSSGSLFGGTYQIDLLSQAFKALVALGLTFTVFLSRDPLSVPTGRQLEYYLFLTAASLGMMMLPSSADLLVLYVSMELSSYSLYLLTALRRDRKNAESGVKYLIFGAATSGVFLWGSSFVLALSGSASFAEISRNIAALGAEPAFTLGVTFMAFAFLFKLSALPFHFWAPDVYETAATPVTNFIATASKAAAVAVLVRLFRWVGIPTPLVTLLAALAFLSMTLGNTVALVQQDVKRLLAYSSVAQAGYILVGLLAGSAEGYSSSLFYAAAYLLMNTGFFAVTIVVAKSAGHDNPRIPHFDGLAERSPLLALLLLISLLSLAGIPPLAGFTGKWILFTAAMERGHWFLVLWAVLNSVVSLFYYLTVVKHAYLEKPQAGAGPLVLSAPMKLFCLFLLASVVLLGIFPDALISFSQQAVSGLVR
jgi:NADH-quinone oxidoreductase subunit N